MVGRIQQSFCWPAMKLTIDEYCWSCDICAALKPLQRANKAPLGMYCVGEPMGRVAIDVLGPLPTSNKGNR